MEKLRYGMVGGGPGAFIGEAHRKALRLDGQAELTAGCFSRDPQKSLETGTALLVDPARCYGSYAEMAAREAARPDGIQFVVVATPNSSHYPICKAFLEAGIHVACDKPLCFTAAEAEDLCRLAREKDLLFLVTYTYMGHVTAKHVRDYIAAGKLGKIRMVMAEYPQGWLAHEGDWGGKQGLWRCDPAQSGPANCLGDLGTHVENAVSTMTGLKIKRVLSKMDILVPGRVLDDNDMVLVEYEGGASGMYWTSQVAIGCDNSLQVRIFGEKGSLLWKQEDADHVTVILEDGSILERHRGGIGMEPAAAAYGRLPAGHVEGWFGAMANLYQSFLQCIRAKQDGTFTADMIDFPTAEDGAESIRFVEACLQSSQNGNTWVDL